MVPEGGIVLENRTAPRPASSSRTTSTVAILLPGPPRRTAAHVGERGAARGCANTSPRGSRPCTRSCCALLGVGETRVQILVEKRHPRARPGRGRLLRAARRSRPAPHRRGPAIWSDRPPTSPARNSATPSTPRAPRRWRRSSSASPAPRAKPSPRPNRAPAGLVASRITNVSGSSEMFRYGWVTYANEAKMTELGVPPELLEKHGAVSAEVARSHGRGRAARTAAPTSPSPSPASPARAAARRKSRSASSSSASRARAAR